MHPLNWWRDQKITKIRQRVWGRVDSPTSFLHHHLSNKILSSAETPARCPPSWQPGQDENQVLIYRPVHVLLTLSVNVVPWTAYSEGSLADLKKNFILSCSEIISHTSSFSNVLEENTKTMYTNHPLLTLLQGNTYSSKEKILGKKCS